jgi:hypothetical protein
MDIKAIKKELAGMFATLYKLDEITGLPTTQHLRANAQAPMSLAETDLPTWILFTGSASYPNPPDQTVDRLAKETRDIMCCLYVCLQTAGIDGEAERKVEPYIDYSRSLIQSHPLLYDGNISDIVPGIMRAYLIKDDGIVLLPYGNPAQKYDGLRFTIRIEGLNEVIYGNE